MKKVLKLVISIALIAIAFTACSRETKIMKSASKNDETIIPTQSPVTITPSVSDEIPSDDECNKRILPDILNAINDINSIKKCALNCDSEITVNGPKDGVTYYKVEDPRFTCIEDLDNYLNTYLTSKIRKESYSDIMDVEKCDYIEKDGQLYRAEAQRSDYIEWTDSPAVISNKTETSFTATKEYNRLGMLGDVRIDIVRGENGWFIDFIDMPKDDSGIPVEGCAVYLKDCGSNKIQVIKVIREKTGCGLAEAKDIADNAPTVIQYGLTQDEAESFKTALEEVGATVEIQ